MSRYWRLWLVLLFLIRFRNDLLGTFLGLPVPILLYTLFFGSVAEWLHWPVPAGL